MTQPAVPTVIPKGVPAWALRLLAALILACGPVIAFVDPGATKFTPLVKAVLIIAFLLAALTIFAAHLWLSATHEYGWSMSAVRHAAAGVESEVTELWPEIKSTYQAAAPAVEQLGSVQGTIDSLKSDVDELKKRTDAAGLNPEAVKKALEVATGMTWPSNPAVTGQAS